MNDAEKTPVVSVSQLTQAIKSVLESGFSTVWVRGEVSNFKRHSSGHLYFTLKDEKAQISAAMFRSDAIRCPIALRDGMQVVAMGNISVYEQRGNYQILVRDIMEEGLGKLQAEFEKLKRKLEAEGLFSADRKKPIPTLPRTVGIVTSPTGAAIRDFISILRRRNWTGRVLVFPASVQGKDAIPQIVDQIKAADACGLLDLLVVGRGGGSLEDLWCFNEEPVVRAVAESNTPVISAVGHEIDFVLTDFAADRRAETPSAAAELISSGYIDICARLDQAKERISRQTRQVLALHASNLDRLNHQLARHSPRSFIENRHLRLDDLANRMQAATRDAVATQNRTLTDLRQRLRLYHPSQRMDAFRERLAPLPSRLNKATTRSLEHHISRIDSIAIRLENLSVQKVLSRGFVMMRDSKGKITTDSATLKNRQELLAEFRDGSIKVRVDKDPQMDLF